MFTNSKYVYEIYKEKSFSKAARNLYISQPALSATIKRIETGIGSPIFDRSTNPIRLTDCGQKYIEAVKQIMDLQDDFTNYLNDLQQLKTGRVSIGGSSLFTSCVLPSIIAEFTKRYPAIEINVVEANTPTLEQQLMSGSLDLMIDNYAFDESVHTGHLFRKEYLLLAVPAQLPVNRELAAYSIAPADIRSGAFLRDDFAEAPLDAFNKQPFILLKAGNDTRDRALHLFQKHGITPKIVLSLDQQMTAYNVTCSGMGISLVSDTLVMNSIDNPNVVFYKLNTQDSCRSLCFFRKSGKYVTRAMEEFLRIATELSGQPPYHK